MTVDTSRDTGFKARVKVYGVKEPVVFEGSLQRILMQLSQHIYHLPSLKRDSHGNRTFNVEFTDGKFDKDSTPTRDDEAMQFMSEMGVFDDVKMSDDPLPPWTYDEDMASLRKFNLNRENYTRAVPGEIAGLIQTLHNRYRGQSWTDHDGNVWTIEDVAVDSKKHL